jgi:Mor family transcriptional regulator
MYDKPWLDELTEEDMPNEELKLIASLCGVKTAIALMKYLPGVMICIPNKSLIKLRNNYVRKKYDGTKKSLIELSRALCISERQIFNILSIKDS